MLYKKRNNIYIYTIICSTSFRKVLLTLATWRYLKLMEQICTNGAPGLNYIFRPDTDEWTDGAVL